MVYIVSIVNIGVLHIGEHELGYAICYFRGQIYLIILM